MRPGCQYTANATTWISHITNVARDQVNVDMHARLTSSLPDVNANVVPIGPVIALYKMLCLVQETKNGALLLNCHVKEACDVALWDYEHVSAAQ
jgi:hypothetical protein